MKYPYPTEPKGTTMKYPYPTEPKGRLKCPVCGSRHISNRKESDEYTFTSEGHKITFKVDKLHCALSSKCQFTWTGEVTHDRILWETYKYFSTLVFNEEWEVAATQAAVNGEAYNVQAVVNLMEGCKVPIDEMETWIRWARNKYPCLLKSNVGSGVQNG